ncbi:MAG: S-methyl-5'-thioadenosine phosphorylase [Actinomycetota bacterium]|nr:S-methyl-5'-thioadenosine phosphorylase [Actinomycetota bacterium]MDQ2957447.1 S-methyl-5'-thioadenosine phosphorylase [Actinomycetota bacterium]
MTTAQAELGVIGGSGFYSLLDDAETVAVSTPYGDPSGPLTIGTVGGRRVAFLPRHGTDHRFPPHRVPYRANLYALRAVGVRQLVTGSAVGSLKPELGPGTLVLPDQIIDRTWRAGHTYSDADNGVAHLSFADPYCPSGRAAAIQAAAAKGTALTESATIVVINGPRFSTRAESLDYQRTGASIIGMTTMPEAALARELAICFTSLCLVTDHDAGVEAGQGVTHAEVLEKFAENLPRLRGLLIATLAGLPAEQGDCGCAQVLNDLSLPYDLP